MKRFITYCCVLMITLLGSCKKEQAPPNIIGVDPEFGPAETLVTFEGTNLSNLQTLTFSGQEVNFNLAYNSDNALLFRIPANVPIGIHEVAFTTPGGTATTQFRVTLEPPEIFNIQPESAAPGEEVTIYGENFFDPVEVYFFDSIKAEIVALTPDSLKVIVPEGIKKGFIGVSANGGYVYSPVNFFSINNIWVNDFDGNGMRAETNKWIFQGSVNQNATNAVQNSNPPPINGNFLKLSGRDNLGISWIGGAQTYYGFPGDNFETFGITTSRNNTLLELDINSNGKKNTHIILILIEKDGSPNDFTEDIHVNWDGWKKVSVPLNRFNDLNGVIVNPAKVRALKIHLIDEDDSNTTLEVNVDNIRFVEIL
ncbi:MAG: IPT/TIG domain-containing protein [Chitinophagales bacterium]